MSTPGDADAWVKEDPTLCSVCGRESCEEHLPQDNALVELLNNIIAFVRRFVVLNDDQVRTVVLWIAHTHVLEASASDCTPYLQVTSATKGCGKTLLLEVAERLVHAPWLTGRVSAAALVRKIDEQQPTLLLDESDTAFNGDQVYAEALRGLLNSGYRRSGCVTLCIGQGAKITFKDFKTFSAKAIAGIGELPDTIGDRAIRIELKKRMAAESRERWRERAGRVAADPLQKALATWAKEPGVVERLQAARPELPSSLGDRAADIWEPLLAIAEMAGGAWPATTRMAAMALSCGIEDDDLGVQLLADIREIFPALLPGAGDEDAFIATTPLVDQLIKLVDRPWATVGKDGKALTGHGLARRLKRFGIIPKPNTRGDARGYWRSRFKDPWSRYLAFQSVKPPNSQ